MNRCTPAPWLLSVFHLPHLLVHLSLLFAFCLLFCVCVPVTSLNIHFSGDAFIRVKSAHSLCVCVCVCKEGMGVFSLAYY